ncbi:hypothetical protein PTRA_a2685 [Pseudoalteromonas translucida KMM 520]|uniref:Uncharacterized protein n=1 Tax=Pseudoalteromonas translucida KMM 520 TaxID=1315283 RepID=A0A0U2WFC4_9GAMM|nr:hypothetical protein PTRA_a2685 [Pseudoalteromonas translucida KMM 520]
MRCCILWRLKIRQFTLKQLFIVLSALLTFTVNGYALAID